MPNPVLYVFDRRSIFTIKIFNQLQIEKNLSTLTPIKFPWSIINIQSGSLQQLCIKHLFFIPYIYIPIIGMYAPY